MTKTVVVGGGLTGCSIAFHLAQGGAAGDVVVVEPDPTYEFAATPRSVGGIRTVFGVPINAQMSLESFDIYKDLPAYLGLPAETVDAGFRQQGYMFAVGSSETLDKLTELEKLLTAVGASVEVLDRSEMQNRWPQINSDDLAGGIFSAQDGAVDPNAILHGFRRASRNAGVTFLTDKVVGFDHDGRLVRTVKLASGDKLVCDVAVNATNYWAPEVCGMVGMEIPVKPLSRQTFYFDCRAELDPFPVIRDDTGFVIRPEGKGYLAGLTDPASIGSVSHQVDYSLFETELWMRLATRCPAFEAVKVQSGWAGIYDVNTLDGNPIIGPWVGGLSNFYVVAGFSGHGLQHAPSVGRGVAELLLKGRYETLDLSLFGYERVLEGRPIEDFGPNA